MNKLKFIFISFLLFKICLFYGQANLSYGDKQNLTTNFEKGKPQFGFGITLKVDLVKSTFAYFRLSLTGGAGLPIGRDIGLERNNFCLYYFAELDIFRGGMGAPAMSIDNQKILFELRQSFLTAVGSTLNYERYNYTRPVMQFVSNSSHPLYDPFNSSFTIGTTFVNGLNIKRSQRVGIASIGYQGFQLTYLNDGPPFTSDWLPYGDGFDRWWTGSGQIGIYNVDYPLLRSIEIKYDKFTGLQPYAYELSTALHMKHIPYKSKEIQLSNRQRIEISVATDRGIGFSYNIYDLPLFDIQHYIHQSSGYSFHSTPLKWKGSTGFFYNNAFLIQ